MWKRKFKKCTSQEACPARRIDDLVPRTSIEENLIANIKEVRRKQDRIIRAIKLDLHRKGIA